jgi:hypothetical protein
MKQNIIILAGFNWLGIGTSGGNFGHINEHMDLLKILSTLLNRRVTIDFFNSGLVPLNCIAGSVRNNSYFRLTY